MIWQAEVLIKFATKTKRSPNRRAYERAAPTALQHIFWREFDPAQEEEVEDGSSDRDQLMMITFF